MNMMYLAVAAGAYLVLKSRDSGNGKTAMAAKHPAFTYPPNQTMDRDTEVKLADALNAHAGINREGFRTVKRTVEELVALGVESPANPTHLQSWGFTEDEHQIILSGQTPPNLREHQTRLGSIQGPNGCRVPSRQSGHGPNLRIQRSLLNRK